MKELLDCIWLPLALGLGFMFLWLFARLHVGEPPAKSEPKKAAPPRDTFTEEEILMYGVDVRSPHARNQIKYSKYAQEHGMTPMQQFDRFQKQTRRRMEDSNTREIVNGEVVDDVPQLGAGRRRLRG